MERYQRQFYRKESKEYHDLKTVKTYLRFMWQGLSSIGAAGVASVNIVQKLPHIKSEPASASSKTDPLLAKAKPVSNVGFSSVRANLMK